MQLAASLKDNRMLKMLDVGGNNIGADGGKALAAALRGNESLQVRKPLQCSVNVCMCHSVSADLAAMVWMCIVLS